MDCRQARHLLIRRVRGERIPGPREALADHLETCGDCRRAWAALDPVAAARAFGDPVAAPADLVDDVLARVRTLPLPRRWRIPVWLSAGGVLGLWVLAGLLRPLAVSGVLLALQILAADMAVTVQAWTLAVHAVHPALPVMAGLIVLGELLVLHRWVHTVV